MEVRGLRRDIADREAFIGQLRAQAAQYRAEIDAIRTELGRLRVHVSEQERLRAPMLDEQEQQRHESARLSVALQHERSTSDDLRAMLTSMQAKLDASSNELRRAQSELQAMSAYASSAGFQLVNWVIIRLKGFPPVYKALQSIARALVR